MPMAHSLLWSPDHLTKLILGCSITVFQTYRVMLRCSISNLNSWKGTQQK